MQNQPIKPEIKSNLIQNNIPLKDKNWFRTGGEAKFYCQPIDENQFKEAILFAKINNLEIFVLGEGANILISDDGFDGLVIHPKLNHISILSEENDFYSVLAQAGTSFQNLIDFCLNNNLLGLEEFSGIPGTVGGSVYINIHYFEFLLSKFLVNATVIDFNGNILKVDNSWFNFGYNSSTLHNKEYFLVDAIFKLKRCSDLEAAYAKGRRDETIRHRLRRYPNLGTCGSFFRNFYESEVKLEVQNKKMIFVAYYLDKLGIKGELQVGDAKISYQHANMIVNLGNATSTDIFNLAKKVQELVKEKYGIVPRAECQLIGFKNSSL
ncbi:UDP-N-acetylenolpyruvoylglucosamine reductase [candidate division TM6 bacterium RIFCSPHIGHO2_12_FULL_32_22]|nr:MAG: UDP-N-acetylenolpyruvoylglucosamine reductase [candidate division TM6 bacterium RIFCSPHIGHO2_12_FULL_32_22]